MRRPSRTKIKPATERLRAVSFRAVKDRLLIPGLVIDAAEQARIDPEPVEIALAWAAAGLDGGAGGIRGTDHRKGAAKQAIANGLTEGHCLSFSSI